jgi:hypothetical protein
MTKDFNTLILELEDKIKSLQAQISETVDEIKAVEFAKALELKQISEQFEVDEPTIGKKASTATLNVDKNFDNLVSDELISNTLFAIFKINKE